MAQISLTSMGVAVAPPSVTTMVKRGQDVNSISLAKRMPGLASPWLMPPVRGAVQSVPICIAQFKELGQVDNLSSPVGCPSLFACLGPPRQQFVV